MALLFTTVAEYDEEIADYRAILKDGMKSKEWQLDTSQSRQKNIMDVKEIRLYLNQLIAERKSCYERSVGAGVTSIVYRRTN